jgi:hypothetical protein
MVEQAEDRQALLAFLVRCAAHYCTASQSDPAELVKRFVQSGAPPDQKRRAQIWMLFQLADSMFADPEELRHLLNVDRWARRVGIREELQEIQSRLLSGLGEIVDR